MPGPTRWRGELIGLSVSSRKVSQNVLNERVRNVLKLVEKVKHLGIPEDAEEKTIDTPKKTS